MAKRLDSDVRAFAERMQERREEAKTRVAAGEIQHLNFLTADEIKVHIEKNLAHVAAGEEPEKHLADAANYWLALMEK